MLLERGLVPLGNADEQKPAPTGRSKPGPRGRKPGRRVYGLRKASGPVGNYVPPVLDIGAGRGEHNARNNRMRAIRKDDNR